MCYQPIAATILSPRTATNNGAFFPPHYVSTSSTPDHPSRLRKQFQATPVLPNLAHLADPAHLSLELGLVLRPVIRTLLVRRAAVDGRVAGGADIELGELVELDLDCIAGVALTLLLRLVGLEIYVLAFPATV